MSMCPEGQRHRQPVVKTAREGGTEHGVHSSQAVGWLGGRVPRAQGSVVLQSSQTHAEPAVGHNVQPDRHSSVQSGSTERKLASTARAQLTHRVRAGSARRLHAPAHARRALLADRVGGGGGSTLEEAVWAGERGGGGWPAGAEVVVEACDALDWA